MESESAIYHSFFVISHQNEIKIKCNIKAGYGIRSISDYIIGDPRFSSIKRSKKDIIFAWTKKEYSNLSRALEVGIRVPRPVFFDRNILLMEFMGEDEVPYPQLRQAKIDRSDCFAQLLAVGGDLVGAVTVEETQ